MSPAWRWWSPGSAPICASAHCEIRPGVETDAKSTEPYQWTVSGVTRDVAYVVSESGGRPAYGGTPADAAVVSAIQDLTARGFAVTFYPFIAMDVPAGNSLPNPYGGTGQPPYPWRGRITCDPAPGEVGTVDKTGDLRHAGRRLRRHGGAGRFLDRRRRGHL